MLKKMHPRLIRGVLVPVALAGCLASRGVAAAPDTSPPLPTSVEIMKLPGGAVVRAVPGTGFSTDRPTRLQLGPANTPKTPAQQLTLLSGQFEIHLPELVDKKAPTTAVVVRTQHNVTVIAKGGRSLIRVTEEGTTVASYSGDMLIGHQEKWRGLRAGVVREYRVNGYTDHAALGAPSVALSAPIQLELSEPRSTMLRATATLAGAQRYEFGIWKTGEKEPTLIQRVASERPEAELPKLTPGSYALSARGIDVSGLASPESALIPFHVVRAELPSGARLIDGAIVMGPDQRLKLHGKEGIEVSYDRVPWFSGAPESVGLYQGKPTLLRLRSKGSTDELRIPLEPLTILAEIDLGPRRARWPQDGVPLGFRLIDAQRRPLPSDIGVKAVVTVNRVLVPVTWKRDENNTITARVPRPRDTLGPWRIQLDLHDETGRPIGRDFIEVASE